MFARDNVNLEQLRIREYVQYGLLDKKIIVGDVMINDDESDSHRYANFWDRRVDGIPHSQIVSVRI